MPLQAHCAVDAMPARCPQCKSRNRLASECNGKSCIFTKIHKVDHSPGAYLEGLDLGTTWIGVGDADNIQVVAVPKIVAHLLGTDTLQELSRGMLVALWRRRALVTSVLAAAARRSRSPGLAVTNEFACFRSFVRIMRQ